ncbi:MAG: hypothetical protein U0414_10390 [Polyangiaceae bacterium]
MHAYDNDHPWVSWYVPHKSGEHSGYESFFRIGGPDALTEQALRTSLNQVDDDKQGEEAVRRSFNADLSGGLAFYTEGDLRQFVGGNADVRVLREFYSVHVLTDGDSTARSYLRLGKPNYDIEEELYKEIAADKVRGVIKTSKQEKAVDPNTRDIGAASGDLATGDAAAITAARDAIATLALSLDTATLNDLEALRVDGAANADAMKWAETVLTAAMAVAIQRLQASAADNVEDAKTALRSLADEQVGLAVRAIVELASMRGGTSANADARAWAKELVEQHKLKDIHDSPRFSEGEGVALYSDLPITLTSARDLKFTMAQSSTTVLGETYAEVYSVSADVPERIRSGLVNSVEDIKDKSLVTAQHTLPVPAGWRTRTFDLAKQLSVTAGDSGAFGVGSELSFYGGLKSSATLGFSFDSSVAWECSAPLGFKTELSSAGLETVAPWGAVSFKSKSRIIAESITLSAEPTGKVGTTAAKKIAKAFKIAIASFDGLVLLYTATIAGVGTGAPGTVKGVLAGHEVVYGLWLSMNTLFTAASIAASVVQLVTDLTTKAATAASPKKFPEIVINEAGVKIQAGTSYVHVSEKGVDICGTQYVVGAPLQNLNPIPVPSTATSTQVMDIVNTAATAVQAVN